MGPEASLAFPFSPAVAALNLISNTCSSHKPYLIWGVGRRGLESGVSPTCRLYLQTREDTWKDGLTSPPPPCSPEHFNKSQKLRFKLLASPSSLRCPARGSSYLFIAAPAAVHTTPWGGRRHFRPPLCKHRCALSPRRVIIVQPWFPAPRSDGTGTERRLQRVSQGLVNVSALAHHRLHFEPYTACYW